MIRVQDKDWQAINLGAPVLIEQVVGNRLLTG